MHNTLAVFWRDLKRLARVPLSWIIIVALWVLPAMYAWVNVIGFWDPYGRTQRIEVSVASEDKGTDNALMGKMNLGDQIIATLKTNKDIGWKFTDTAQAMRDVEAGDSYAAIIIPKDFSDNLGALITGGKQRPQLDYYVNEKASPIAPKVTDTAAGTVDRQVNETFVSTVSKVVTEAANKAGDSASQAKDNALDKTTAVLATVHDDVAQARATIKTLDDTLSGIPEKTKNARADLDTLRTLGTNADDTLQDASKLLTDTQTSVTGFSANVTKALSAGTGDLSQALTLANGLASSLNGSIATANGHVGGAIDAVGDVNDAIGSVIATLRQHTADLPELDGIIARLQSNNDNLAGAITDLKTLNSDLGTIGDNADALSQQINQSAQGTLDNINTAQQGLVAGAVPQLNSGLATLSASASSIGTAITAQSALVDQAGTVLTQLDDASASAVSALESTDKSLAGIQDRLSTMGTDLSALKDANVIRQIMGAEGGAQDTDDTNGTAQDSTFLDVDAIADFMLSPTILDTHTLYPVNSYGSGMAPLFTNLSMWVGAFMLVVLLRLEADDEGITALTPTQGYLGRWLLLALMGVMQGLVVTAGDLIIGVQSVNPAAFLLTGALTSLVYVSIAYALSLTFLHIGKALCMVLIILQIPGASGLYPIEMMPAFFRNLYPYFPFSYGIAAMRETIGGFYDGHWMRDMGHLALYAALAFALGLFVRPRIANLNRMFAREIAESDIMRGEPVSIRGREYPIAQALHALGDRAEYREYITDKAARFAELYPRLKRGALIVGLVVPLALVVTFSLTTDTKLEALAAWTVWVLIVIAFLLMLEYARDSVRRQVELGTLSDETIQEAISQREREREASLRQKRQWALTKRARRGGSRAGHGAGKHMPATHASASQTPDGHIPAQRTTAEHEGRHTA